MVQRKLTALVWLLLASAAVAQTQSVTVSPGLNDLSVTLPNAESDVTWEARDPFAFPFNVYATADGKSVACFYIASGSAVIVSDVIDWENRSRTKTSWVITVDGEPGPEPNPSPDPKPDLTGVALDAYKLAKKINDPKAAKAIATNYLAVAAAVAARSDMSVLVARDDLRTKNKSVQLTKDWSPFSKAMGAWQNEYVQTRQAVIKYFPEIASGLDEAAK